MASIKKLDERRYKITVSNGYRPNGKKISKAKTIQVPSGVPKRGIGQYVAHAAEELERSFKTGYAEDGEMTFEEFASRWLERQTKYAPSTIAAYRRMLEVVYPMIGGIRLNKLRPMALENMNSRNDYRHFIIIRVARFIHRQRYVKYICILCIEIMAVIELPIMGRFVNCCCNKYRCVFRQILRMYDCDMIITAINIISIFRRAEHIDCGCILLEHLDLVADICRNAF